MQDKLASLINFKTSPNKFNDKVKLPTANQWQVIEKTIVMLRQFARLTEHSCRADASISSVIPSLAAISYFLSSDEMVADMSGVNTMRAELVKALKSRFKTLHEDMLFAVATALDPRHKLRFFDARESAAVTQYIINCLPKPIVPLTNSQENGDSSTQPPAKKRVTGYWDCYELASKMTQSAEDQNMHENPEDSVSVHGTATASIGEWKKSINSSRFFILTIYI
jgi:hypothetical protein